MDINYKQLAADAARELCETAHLSKGSIMVVGCSTSEILGFHIGKNSVPEVAQAVFSGCRSAESGWLRSAASI